MHKQIWIAAAVLGCSLCVSGCKKEEAPAPVTAPTTSAVPAAPTTQAVQGGSLSNSAPSVLNGKAMTPGGKGNIELLNKSKINKMGQIKGNEPQELEGWSIDEKGKTVPETVVLQLVPTKGGAEFFTTAERIKKQRPDIVKFFKDAAFKEAGFTAKFDASALPAGVYGVRLIQVVGDKAYVSGPYVKIEKIQ